jgi:hypothetical protein
MPTNVPKPVFGDKGFVGPSESAILAGVQADINLALGGNVNPRLNTPQGQIATTETAVIGDSNATFLYFSSQVDPAFSSGRMQDAIGRIYFQTRIPGAPTTVQATCRGLTDVPIPVGALARATDGNIYICQAAGTIGLAGTVVLPFACIQNGPIPAPVASVNQVYQAIPGWDSITNTEDGVLGRNVESRSEFEARRAASVAANARGILDSIQGAVLAVPGVVDALVIDNPLDTPVVIYGYFRFGETGQLSGFNDQPFYTGQPALYLGPHSLYVCALGGTDQAVGEAIWTKKAPGCGYNGNTTVIVVDPSPDYSPPVPTYYVTFERPIVEDFTVQVTLQNSTTVPSDALAQIQNAVINAFAGADGGSRARIGGTVLASRYYGPVALLGSWAQIISIKVGLTGQVAVFTGSITGTVLTVSAMNIGTIEAGQLLQDAGLMASGTTVVDQLTGTTGGIGTYTVSVDQTIPSEAMNCTDLLDDVALNINQVPAISAGEIHLTLV